MGKLGADLMGSSRDQLAFHKRQAVPGGKGFVVCLAGLGPGLRAVRHENTVFDGVFEKIALEAPFFGLWGAFYDGQIPLVDFPVLDLLIHDPQGFGGFGCDDNAPGVPVDAVAQGGGEGVLFPGPPFVLLVQVSLNLIDERPPVFRPIVGVHRKARALVHQKDVLILIDDVQLGGGNGQIGVVFSGGVEEFVVDVELQLVAHFQPGIPLGPLAVALDALQTDVFLGQRGRQQGNGLCQKPIQPLTGIILADGQFFHSFPSSSAKCLLIWSVNSWAAL